MMVETRRRNTLRALFLTCYAGSSTYYDGHNMSNSYVLIFHKPFVILFFFSFVILLLLFLSCLEFLMGSIDLSSARKKDAHSRCYCPVAQIED